MALRVRTPLLNDGGGAVAYTLTAEAGTYNLIGVAAGLRASRELDGAAGSYAITGVDAGLRRGYTLTGEAGSYSLIGVAAGLRATRELDGAAGSYAITGVDAALVYEPVGSYVLGAAAGSYEVTGQDATFSVTRAYRLTAEAGAYTITGQNAALNYSAAVVPYTPPQFPYGDAPPRRSVPWRDKVSPELDKRLSDALKRLERVSSEPPRKRRGKFARRRRRPEDLAPIPEGAPQEWLEAAYSTLLKAQEAPLKASTASVNAFDQIAEARRQKLVEELIAYYQAALREAQLEAERQLWLMLDEEAAIIAVLMAA